jgi:opacity protein-like surface antigen
VRRSVSTAKVRMGRKGAAHVSGAVALGDGNSRVCRHSGAVERRWWLGRHGDGWGWLRLAGLEVLYGISERFAVGVDGSWFRNATGKEDRDPNIKDRLTVWQSCAVGKYTFSFNGPVGVYAKLGLGISYLEQDLSVAPFGDFDHRQFGPKLGSIVGVGALYRINGVVGFGIKGRAARARLARISRNA